VRLSSAGRERSRSPPSDRRETKRPATAGPRLMT